MYDKTDLHDSVDRVHRILVDSPDSRMQLLGMHLNRALREMMNWIDAMEKEKE